jgi:hypothetical protein
LGRYAFLGASEQPTDRHDELIKLFCFLAELAYLSVNLAGYAEQFLGASRFYDLGAPTCLGRVLDVSNYWFGRSVHLRVRRFRDRRR